MTTGLGYYFAQFPQQCFSQRHGSHDSIDILLSGGDDRTRGSARVDGLLPSRACCRRPWLVRGSCLGIRPERRDCRGPIPWRMVLRPWLILDRSTGVDGVPRAGGVRRGRSPH